MTVRKFMDVSTGHLTRDDVELLQAGALPIEVLAYEYGWIISTAGLMGIDGVEENAAKLSASGLSGTFIEVARAAGARDCWILRFDADADLDLELPIGGYGLDVEDASHPG
ncbi:hypothetical protein [Antarcticirhabdus aurantiaca]|uniref:Uncharacterized protein n=1 Tax=Antarcticirhabdus aurantiaca TaxID=2606717 RepID=A0ACD4NPN6_9HYPH|nr:hypothetical protein [Antarcticirhabdus aurantiaca]WAJ28851.1 hypothetical protein OXU80_00950 [Jeongeuplla avenae]